LDTEKEKILIAEIKSNPEKFGALYDEYYHSIFSYIFRRLGDYELARDIASETFLKAYLKIHSFEWRGASIVFWLFRIATNEINLYFRNNKYVLQSFQYAINKNAFALIDNRMAYQEKEKIENELKQHDEFIAIQAQLKRLKVNYQEVIALRYFEQKSIKEISIILNKKEGTVKSLLSRGVEKLKNLL
jgi:RNA polymerase sigma-70 factor (ECF subfamily)